jgi:hypothetical protein
MLKKEWDTAIVDFQNAFDRSLAVQPIYWLSRLRKSECLMHTKRHALAIPELKLFLQRSFSENDPNIALRPKATSMLAECEKVVKG